MAFKPIQPDELNENVFTLLGERWTLITASDGEKVNAMTASWGGLGVMWKRNVAYVVVRKSRHTLGLIDRAGAFSLAFFGEGHYRKELAFCGANSGRDTDKLAHCGFTAGYSGKVPYIEQAQLVLVCKPLSRTPLEPEMFLDASIGENYLTGDYHVLFIAEITEALIRE